MYNGLKYCVIIYHNFDADIPIYMFDTYEKAKEYLYDVWKYYCNEEITARSGIEEDLTYYEDEFAQIKWNDGCCTQFILTCTSEPMKINGKDYK